VAAWLGHHAGVRMWKAIFSGSPRSRSARAWCPGHSLHQRPHGGWSPPIGYRAVGTVAGTALAAHGDYAG